MLQRDRQPRHLHATESVSTTFMYCLHNCTPDGTMQSNQCKIPPVCRDLAKPCETFKCYMAISRTAFFVQPCVFDHFRIFLGVLSSNYTVGVKYFHVSITGTVNIGNLILNLKLFLD